MKPGSPIFVMSCSFAGVTNKPEEDYAKLLKYCMEEEGFDLKEVFGKENATLLVDDAQLIYHVSEFWVKFKGI